MAVVNVTNLRRRATRHAMSIVAAAAAVGAVALAVLYRVDGIPLPSAGPYLSGPGFSTGRDRDGTLTLTPRRSNGRGLVIVPGALIRPMSYAKSAAHFARAGYEVVVPASPLRLSILARRRISAVVDARRDLQWFAIGHSMGGTVALDLAHRSRVRGAALWAATVLGDHSTLDPPIIYIAASNDGLLPPNRQARARHHLAATARTVVIEGGNHANFALYSHQIGDRPATIDRHAQIDAANAATACFFDEITTT